MAARYPQFCPVARSLEIIGERWTMLILRDLLLEGPRRFHDFERAFPGMSPNTLSARLKTLEDAGLVTRRLYEAHPPRAEYALTDKGEALRPVLKALKDWGLQYVLRAGAPS
ncbi:MAG: winged helix-turn-helix transcriptional regulator [Caulobacterales bacterium]